MPTTDSAKKRLRQSEKRRQRNQSRKSRIRTLERNVLQAETAEEASRHLEELYAALDRAAAKGVIHENKAARKKSRLAEHVAELTG